MTMKTCPVCGHQQSDKANDCAQCGWDYPVLLGNHKEVETDLFLRLASARELWQKKSKPDLKSVTSLANDNAAATGAAEFRKWRWKSVYSLGFAAFCIVVSILFERHLADEALWRETSHRSKQSYQYYLDHCDICTKSKVAEYFISMLLQAEANAIEQESKAREQKELNERWLNAFSSHPQLKSRIKFPMADPCQGGELPVLIPPKLTRDAFETPDEFLQRKKREMDKWRTGLTERPWCVGRAVLLRDQYGVNHGVFPVRFEGVRNWLSEMPFGWFAISRDAARLLYERATNYPVWAFVEVDSEYIPQLYAAAINSRPVYWLDRSALSRYESNTNGTVTDRQTKLMWQRCSVGQQWNGLTCTGTATSLNWYDASALEKDGWRLPTVDELNTLVFCSSGHRRPSARRDGHYVAETNGWCQGDFSIPTVNQLVFPNTPLSYFWSSSSHAHYSGHAWGINFQNGIINESYKEVDYPSPNVRLVRSGQ